MTERTLASMAKSTIDSIVSEKETALIYHGNWGQIDNDFVKALINEIISLNLKEITRIDFSNNIITTDGVKAIAQVFWLQILDLSSNPITNEDLEILSTSLKELRVIDVSDCKLITDIKPLLKLSNLTDLHADFCSLSEIPLVEIQSHQKLEKVHVFPAMHDVPVKKEEVEEVKTNKGSGNSNNETDNLLYIA